LVAQKRENYATWLTAGGAIMVQSASLIMTSLMTP